MSEHYDATPTIRNDLRAQLQAVLEVLHKHLANKLIPYTYTPEQTIQSAS